MSEPVRQGYSTNDHNHKSYDVFISFRGADTRNNFTDHLYNALVEANITTFLDEEEIETGEDLKPELVNAIKSSRVSIIVLSKNYATSTWCLDELALILHQRLISDHIVIPIFYHVEPTDVRKQQNSFGDAIASHKQRMEAETNSEKRIKWTKKMDRWIKALTQVADLKGKGVKDRREAGFIREIVANIHRIIGGHLTRTLPLLFGMEDSIDFISSWLIDGSSHTSDILIICGMGGIGKTSLAKYVHGSYCHLFKISSFIESIGEKCAAHGLLVLQKQLYCDISKTSQFQVHDTTAYMSLITRAVTRKKVFIVLDNIDSVNQLHALLGEPKFYPGSKIIITTKDVSLVEQYVAINPIVQGNHKKCLLEGLHKKASSLLLSHHAFMSDQPKEGYEEVSEKLMAYCGGHPLALKVWGESLCNKSVAEWEDCIIGLKEEPDSRIQKALQMSFDTMPSNNDKELFKYIACFFVHEDRAFAETILNSCGIRARIGTRNLIDRCLLTIGPGNCLMMHQLLQEMGRDLVRQESPGKPEESSRLWCHVESFNVLEENKGTGNIKGLVLNMNMLEMEESYGSVKLETYALSKMSNLMLLHLNYVQLAGSYKVFPRKLRWLCMHRFPLKSIPSDLPMENLVALDLSYSNIESFDMPGGTLQCRHGKGQKVTGSCSKEKRLLGSLKFLTLSFCEQLLSLGGFLELPMLQRLIARKCICLTEVCESIENCAELDHIDLSDCHKLDKLPRTIGSSKKIKTLKLDGCDLHELPVEMRDTGSLDILEDKVIGIESKSSSCANLEVLPSNLKFSAILLPSSLVRLSLASNYLSTESFPMDFRCLSMLKDLCLDGNPIVSLPNCVRTLPRIETLSMNNCLMLTSVEYPPHTLTQLNLHCSYWKPGYKVLLRKVLFNREMAPLKLIADRNLLAPSSFEVEGMIKIQPMAGVEEKLLHSLGWPNLKFVKDRCMVTNYNYGGQEESHVQMYYEFGIFSTILPGNHVIESWNGKKYFKTSTSFTIPSTFNNLRGLDLCIVGRFFILPKIRISNITKNRTWIYNHCIESVNAGGEYLTFLSHWMFGMNEMEVGDEISITLEKCNECLMDRCWVKLAYDEDYALYIDDEDHDEDIMHRYDGDMSRRRFDEDIMQRLLSFTRFDEDFMRIYDEDHVEDIMWRLVKLVFDSNDDVMQEEEEDPLDYYKSWNHIIGGDLSPFQLTTGDYFLNSMEFLRTLYSSDPNAHYKEKVVSFRAFPQTRSDMLDGVPPQVNA